MPYFAFTLVQVSDEITLLDNMNIVYYVRMRIVFIYASHTLKMDHVLTIILILITFTIKYKKI